ncbi:MAG: hypothetical protein ABSG51_14995 [Terracidiphilus sp.]|jgi:hypothetical protein
MTNRFEETISHQSMTLLSRLLLAPQAGGESYPPMMAEMKRDVRSIGREEFDNLVALASSNHVIVRGMVMFRDMMREAGDAIRVEWAQTALAAEQVRITTALYFLEEICTEFEHKKYDVTVIKSLDHWPDIGSDLDLYTNAASEDVITLMKRRFGAQLAPRSWGDRLAGKWNFVIAGLSEAVEIHMGRLGQTGEQEGIAAHLVEASRRVVIGRHVFRVPSASDRLMISTLQRMYRHFYFRLCDIVDTIALSASGGIDYFDLRSSATSAGIWEGVATYLTIVSDYSREYGGSGLDFPQFVLEAARFGGDEVYFAKDFLRIPIVPQSAKLYGEQLAGMLRRRELQNGARLSLLPWLATAALVGQRITGTDKGIW